MRNRRNYALLWLLLAILSVAGIALLSWQNYRFVKNNPGGNDFLTEWVGTRTFLMEGISPYSDQTTQKIQEFAYGRPAKTGEPQLRYTNPLYSIAVFFPFALIPDFPSARAAYMTVLEVALFLLIVMSVRLVRWRPGFLELTVFVFFALFWFHSIRPVMDGNSAILVSLLMVAGLLALKNGGDELAGLLFAFATIKPNVILLALIFIVIWALFTGRSRLLGWMAGTLFLLSASSALLLPDWIVQNMKVVITYPTHNPPATLGAVLAASFPAMGDRIARLVYGALAGMLLTDWWLHRKAEFRGMLWTVMFTLTIEQWIGIPTTPQNFIVLLPALALVFANWQERWRRAGRALTLFSILLLFAGPWALFLATVKPGLSLSPLMFLPIPAFLIIALYWVRWWAVRPPDVWFDLIYMQENP